MPEDLVAKIYNQVFLFADNHSQELITIDSLKSNKIIDSNIFFNPEEKIEKDMVPSAKSIIINESLIFHVFDKYVVIQNLKVDQEASELSKRIALQYLDFFNKLNYYAVGIQWRMRIESKLDFKLSNCFVDKDGEDVKDIIINQNIKSINDSTLSINLEQYKNDAVLNYIYHHDLTSPWPRTEACKKIITDFNNYYEDFSGRIKGDKDIDTSKLLNE